MSAVKQHRLLSKLKNRAKTWKWHEIMGLLKYYGFMQIEGRGSRIKFYHPELDCLLNFHRPHPTNEVKQYVIKEIIDTLTKNGIVK